MQTLLLTYTSTKTDYHFTQNAVLIADNGMQPVHHRMKISCR